MLKMDSTSVVAYTAGVLFHRADRQPIKSPVHTHTIMYTDTDTDTDTQTQTQTQTQTCLLYTSPSPRDGLKSRMPSSA